jgi:hypothetical protein
MPMHDVVVESSSGNGLVVLSLATHHIDEELIVYLAMPHGVDNHFVAVTSSAPVFVAGTLCCRLGLRVHAATLLPREKSN